MGFSTLFFDLDETVYPRQSGVWDAIAARIDRYMLEILKFQSEEIYPIRNKLFAQYGTTLKGLQTVCNVDKNDYLQYVHDIPVKELLPPNPGLRSVLLQYPQQKVIFTNADQPHAERVIDALGLNGCFDQITDIHHITPYCKPDIESYQIAIERAGNPQPHECIMLDDKVSNLVVARQLGFYTILVGGNSASAEYDASIAVLEDLPLVLDPHPNGSHLDHASIGDDTDGR
jgi:putative hydrolase of the HAD superfamily